MIKTGKQVKGLISNGDNEIMEILNLISDAEILEMYRNYGVTLLQAMLKDIKEDKKLVNEIKTVTGKNKAGNKAGNKITKAGNKAGNKITKAGNKAGNKITKKINDDEIDDEYDDVDKIQIGKYEIDKYLFEYLKNILNLTHRQTLATLNKVANLKPMKLAALMNEFTIDNSIWEDIIMTGIEYLILEYQELNYYPINATIEDKERYRILELKLFYSCMSRAVYTVFKENGIFTQSVYNRKTRKKESRLTRLEVNNENL